MSEQSRAVENVTSQMPDNQQVKNLSELGRELALELGVQAELEKAIEESKARTSRLQETLIPDLMVELGLEEIKLPTGEKIALKSVYGASVSEERAPVAWQWLRDNGYGSLVKNVVACNFGMGEDELANKLKVTLHKANIPFINKESVHFKTLESFVKDRYENGDKFPEELFGAFTKTVARIKTK